MNAKTRFILILLAIVNFTHIMDFMIMMPLSNFLIPYFKISPQEFSFLVATYSISAAASGLLAAFFVDGFDRKKVLIFGYIGFLIGTFLCALSPTYQLLLAARIVSGLFGGLIGAQILTIAADIVPYEKRGYAMGIIIMAFSISSAFGVPFGLKLSEMFNWHTPFYAVAGMGIILLALLIKFVPSMSTHIKQKRETKPRLLDVFRNIYTDKKQVIALIFTAMLMGQFLVIPFLTSFMEFNVGFTKEQIPYIYLVGGTLTMVSSPLSGKIADKMGKFKFFTIMVLACIPPIAILTNLSPTPFYYVITITGIWFVFSTARTISAQAMVSEVVPPKTRGSFMSINASVQQLSVGIYSLVAGYIIVDTPNHQLLNYDIVGYICIGLGLGSYALGYILNKRMFDKNNDSSISPTQTNVKPLTEELV